MGTHAGIILRLLSLPAKCKHVLVPVQNRLALSSPSLSHVLMMLQREWTCAIYCI